MKKIFLAALLATAIFTAAGQTVSLQSLATSVTGVQSDIATLYKQNTSYKQQLTQWSIIDSGYRAQMTVANNTITGLQNQVKTLVALDTTLIAQNQSLQKQLIDLATSIQQQIAGIRDSTTINLMSQYFNSNDSAGMMNVSPKFATISSPGILSAADYNSFIASNQKAAAAATSADLQLALTRIGTLEAANTVLLNKIKALKASSVTTTIISSP